MAHSIKVIDHKGSKIYYADYRNLPEKELIKQIEENIEYRLKQNAKNTLNLQDLTGTYLVASVQEACKRASKKMSTLEPKATAIVGLTGMTKILLKTLAALTSLQTKPFDTVEEALDWLAAQDK